MSGLREVGDRVDCLVLKAPPGVKVGWLTTAGHRMIGTEEIEGMESWEIC